MVLGWVGVWMMGRLSRGRSYDEKLKDSAMDIFNLKACETSKRRCQVRTLIVRVWSSKGKPVLWPVMDYQRHQHKDGTESHAVTLETEGRGGPGSST